MAETYEIGRALDLIKRIEDEMDGRWKRMDADYKLARSDPYDTNIDAQGDAEGTDFKSFTSTVASAFVKKVVATLSGAKVSIQVRYGAAQTQQRHMYDMKERFAYGVLQEADDALVRLIQLPIHDQLSWFSPNRGWLIGRGIFMNHEDDTTTASIRPWDPINSTWQIGAQGLLWAAHKTRRMLDELQDEWPAAKTIAGQPDDEVDIYEMWTATHNAVFTDGKVFLKKWTRHGSPRCPVIIIPVPTQPKIWSEGILNSEDDYGESILATNRSLYNYISEVMSVALDLLEKARRPSAIAFTEEEDSELAEDPNQGEGVQYLGKDDRFQQLVPPETTHDAIQFMTMTMGMIQRGDLPFSTYGDIQFALSGYAITQLNQQMLTVIGPQTRAMGRFIKEMLDLMVDQYVTGAFNPITVRGMGNNKDYMEMDIPPQALKNLPPFRVMVVAELPQDDVAKLQAAQTARQGPTPFLRGSPNRPSEPVGACGAANSPPWSAMFGITPPGMPGARVPCGWPAPPPSSGGGTAPCIINIRCICN